MVRFTSIMFNGETRRRLNEHDRRWPVKLGLRAFAAFCAFLAMALFAAATNLSKTNYGGNDWVDALPLAPVLLALFYDPIHIFLTTRRPIHPAFPLTTDLLIWGLSLPALVFSIGDGWFWLWQPVLLDLDGLVPCDEYNFWSKACNPMIYTIGRIEIAANVFLALIFIAHFILFVYSCIATHRYRRSARRAAGGAAAGAAMGVERRNIELQYHRSPEEHRRQEQQGGHHHHHHHLSQSQPPAYTPSSTGVSSLAEDGKDRAEGSGGGAAPQLSPMSPVNSGSGGGFMKEGDLERFGAEGPFGDHAAVRYA